MPAQDFELYLSLLSRFLRLKPAQRDEIADELRDHLEERLEELAARGLSRSEAIRAALDEFGDAAELANHFTHVAHIRKRRLIMRFSFGSVAALAAAILISAAFWPESPQAPSPRNASAQGGAGPAAGSAVPKPQGGQVAAPDSEKAAVDAKLAERLGKVELMDVPLSEALEFISDRTGIDILFNRGALIDEGIDLNQPIQLVVKRANLSARAALDLILEPLKLSYTVRDGLIMITTIADANQIQVYNVRDLLRHPAMNAGAGPMGGMGGGMMGGGGGGFFRFAPDNREDAGHQRLSEFEAPDSGVNPQVGAGFGVADDFGNGVRAGDRQLAQGFGGGRAGGGGVAPDPAAPAAGGAAGGMGGMGGMMGGGGGRVHGVTNSLAHVIAMTIDSDSWEDGPGNGSGSIVQYHELLVVKNSQTVHSKIKALLEMMRASAREIPGDEIGEAATGDARAPAGGAGAGAGGASGKPGK
jgi:hypothetical protein